MRRLFRGVKCAAMVILAAAAFGFVVMELWNWVMPAVFGLHTIRFWQALALLVLSKILFGGFRGPRGPRMYWQARMMERWEQMTPEEREKFREGMKTRCGMFGSRAAAPKV